MSPIIIPGHAEEDEKLLGQINIVDRLFGVPLNATLHPTEQKIFDRSLKNNWLHFFDIRPVQTPRGPEFTRIYFLTDAGIGRLKEIRERNKIQVNLNG
jgi:hypothetical protein